MLFGQDQPSKVAMNGLGGVGKTRIALGIVRQTRKRYPYCSVFWIPATNEESVQQAYLHIGQQLGICGINEKQADIKKLVQRHLSQETAGPWLIVFDNADNIDMWIKSTGSRDTLPDLKDYLPRSRQGRILITSRSRKIAVKLAQQNVVEIPKMDKKVALQLLSKSLINRALLNHRRDALELLRQLTYLPLAIVQAAAYINENGITLAAYAALLNDQEQEVIDLLSEEFEGEGRYRNIKNPVAITWLISFEQIRRHDPLAADYLSFMCCIDPKEIPQSLLPPTASRKKETDAIGTLSACSFISRRSIDHSLDLHRLVHLAMRNWLRGTSSLADRTARAVARLEEVFPDHDYNNNRSLWRAYLPHARYVLDSNLLDNEATESI
jgi:NB-ARC domain